MYKVPKYNVPARAGIFAQNAAAPPQAADPEPIGAEIAAAIERRFAPVSPAARAAWKSQLISQISAAAGEDATWWVAGAGADLIVKHGWSAERMNELLGQLRRRRGSPEHDGGHIANPGGWLQHRLRQAAAEVGMPWGKAQTDPCT